MKPLVFERMYLGKQLEEKRDNYEKGKREARRGEAKTQPRDVDGEAAPFENGQHGVRVDAKTI